MTDEVALYTDGSCRHNPGPGGWAALLVIDKNGDSVERVLVGKETHTTNNRMELSAALFGLQALKRSCRVQVITDSNYMVKGMTEWIQGWIRRGWKNSAKKPVENRDLWEALLAASAPHEVRWTWVKAHAGHPENERVDQLAYEQATLALEER